MVGFAFLIAACLMYAVLGHMQLAYPPTFNSSNNPFRTTEADQFLQYPYNCCGRTDPDPCRGYLGLVGTPQGLPVAAWIAGSVQSFNLTGIGNHYGGSCQVGFSVDNGATWQAATSFEGNCPHRHPTDSQNFNFTVPMDIPVGDTIFAWTWFNREQEFNMNCAAITIIPNPALRNDVASTVPPQPTTQPDINWNSNWATPPTEGTGLDSTQEEDEFRLLTNLIGTTLITVVRRNPDVTGTPTDTNCSPTRVSPGHHIILDSDDNHQHAIPVVPFLLRPLMLLPPINMKGCLPPKTTAELKFPAPGPDVVHGDGEYPVELPGPAEACEMSS